MKRTIIHADLNSFFAAVEQQANPFLRHKPVGIIKDVGRTCVIACSDQAKAHGVKTGMPLKDVKTLCPKIILVPADFDKYLKITKQFISLCSHYTNLVEVFSLDEVFLDVSQTKHLYGGALSVAHDIQTRLKKNFGSSLGCSIGIAKNKFLAKLASSLAPRQGILKVTHKNQSQLLASAPFEEVCGIGHRLSKRLKAMGINSLAQILETDIKFLQAEFGPFRSLQLKRLSLGQDNSPVITIKDLPSAKSVSRTFTLFKNTTDQNQIKGLIRNLVEEAVFKLRQMNLVGRQFGITIRGNQQSLAKHITRKTFTDHGQTVFNEVYQLFQNFNWSHPVRFTGIWISLLTRKNYLPQPLFLEDQKQNHLVKIIDQINQTYGYYAVCPGTLLHHKIIKPEANGYLGDKQFQFHSS